MSPQFGPPPSCQEREREKRVEGGAERRTRKEKGTESRSRKREAEDLLVASAGIEKCLHPKKKKKSEGIPTRRVSKRGDEKGSSFCLFVFFPISFVRHHLSRRPHATREHFNPIWDGGKISPGWIAAAAAQSATCVMLDIFKRPSSIHPSVRPPPHSSCHAKEEEEEEIRCRPGHAKVEMLLLVVSAEADQGWNEVNALFEEE